MSKKSWALILIVTGFSIVLMGLVCAYYSQTLEQISSVPLPGQVAGSPLSGRILGRPALDELAWMHGQVFPLTKGAVGIYGTEKQIKLYVAGAPVKFIAGRLAVAMRDKIAESNSPFTPIAEREINQRTIYELDGLGQRHFFFRSDDLVVWLAADETLAEEALEQVLFFYP